MDYTFLLYTYYIFNNRRKIFDDESFPGYLNKVTDSTFNSAICISLSKVSYEIQQNHRPLLVCNEILVTIPIVILFQKNHFLIQTINDKLALFHSAGLIDFWVSKYIDKMFIKSLQSRHHHPKQLNMRQLLGGFQIWIICCVIGSITFFVEIAMHFIIT